MDKRTSQELIKTRNAVKEKYRKLRSDLAANEIKMENTYKPITQPLKQLIKKYDQLELIEPKHEIKEEQYEFPFISTPKKATRSLQTGQTPQLPLEMPSFFAGSRFDSVLSNTAREVPFQETSILAQTEASQESSEESTPTETLEEIINQTRQTIQQYVDQPGYSDYIGDFHELPRTYIDANIRDTDNEFDHKYGVIHDFMQDKFTIGLTQEPIEFKGKDPIVKSITYPGTVGLYELLFKKDPRGYTSTDLDHYMDILKRTKAYTNEGGNVNTSSNRYSKFRKIILPYLNRAGLTKKGARAISGPTTSTFSKPPPPPSRTTRQRTAKLGKGLTLKKILKISTIYTGTMPMNW